MQDIQDQTSQMKISPLRIQLGIDEKDEDDDVEVLAEFSQKVQAGLKAAYAESQRELEEDLQASQAQAEAQDSQVVSIPAVPAPPVTTAIRAANRPAILQASASVIPASLYAPIVLVPIPAVPAQPAQVPPTAQVSQYDEYSRKLITAHDTSLGCLLRTALELTGMPCDIWVQRRKACNKCKFTDLFVELLLMIVGIDDEILEHIVKGDLPKADKENANVRKMLRKLKNMTNDARIPAIYAQFLNDKDGLSPTAAELLLMLDMIELYIRGYRAIDQASVDVAFKIDRAMGKATTMAACQQGERKYLENPTQAKTCLDWIRYTRIRLSDLPANEPLERPISEVGYASKPMQRLAQHAKHTSSNYNMNLSEAACKVFFNGKYFISQYVVMHIVDETHAMYAEIILSRFALAYTAQGGGFSHEKAGSSHGGVDKIKHEYWTELRHSVTSGKSFLAKVKVEVEKEDERQRLFSAVEPITEEHNRVLKHLLYIKAAAQIIEDTEKEVKRKQEESLRWTDARIKLLEMEVEDSDGDVEMTS